jgi:hypothetical protein
VTPRKAELVPETEWAERLEAVRAGEGIESFQTWLDLLNDRTDSAFKYATVRAYHIATDPPPSYLAAVAQAYRVSCRYLLTGDGPIMDPGEILTETVKSSPVRETVRGFRAKHYWLHRCGGWVALGEFLHNIAESRGEDAVGDTVPAIRKIVLREFPSLITATDDTREGESRLAAQFFTEMSLAYQRFL